VKVYSLMDEISARNKVMVVLLDMNS